MAVNYTSEETIPRIFLNSVKKYGDRVALREKRLGIWHDISWNEYYIRAEKISLALIKFGLKKGDRVAIIGDNCPEWVIIDMAIFCAGGVSVGIYSTNSWDQCQYVINHSEAKFYFMENEEQLDKWLQFTDAPCLEKVIVWDLKGLRDFKDPAYITFQEFMDIGSEEKDNNPGLLEQYISDIKPHDHALFIYTSGTTGRPKGAVLTHSNAVWISEAIVKDDPMFENDEVLSFLPLCHIFERIFSVLAHLRQGYIVNFIENIDTVVDNMREVSPTVGYGVPRIWEKYHSMVVIKMSDATWLKRIIFNLALNIGRACMNRKKSNKPISIFLKTANSIADFSVFRKLRERMGFERLRRAYSGAAPISPDVLSFFNSIGINLIEGYGQTEGTGVTTVNHVGKSKIGTVGQPLDGVEINIAPDGEILVKSPGVFQGYYKDKELTDTTLIDGWLHTGDVGELDDEGYLKITGRIKDIIITAGGKNITPQYIEGKLVFSPYINDAIVIGDQKKFLTALIVLDEENTMKYAQDNKIQFSTYSDLTKNHEIINLIQKQIDSANDELSRVEQIKRFTILPHKLYQEEGDVTPTMKVKRKYISEKYKDLIDNMY